MQVLGRAVTRRGWAVAGAALLGLVVLVSAVVVLVNAIPRLAPGAPDCTVEVGGREVELSTEQAETAATISAAVVRRGLPARAASVAVATAWAERDLERPGNIDAYLDALGDVPDYRSMQVEEAAAAVDGARHEEDDYAEHAADARVVASALTGSSRAVLSCRHGSAGEEERDKLAPSGLTGRAATVRRNVRRAFGQQMLGGFAPGGVKDGHMPGSAHYEGRAIDIFYRPIRPAQKVKGWATAQYLVAHAERLAVDTVIFDGRIWTERRAEQGWREYQVDTSGRSKDVAAILEHRDHVHVDVAD
ncbi:MAG TPA: hypothetical protein VFJ28_11805 [Marmoricola sp.]|nr:hypothetical protein [Marmoricola sp.]